MSSPAPEAPQAETPAQETAPLEQRVDNLSDKVDQILAHLKPGGSEAGTETDPEPAADVAAEVRAELAKLKSAEQAKAKRDQDKADTESRLAAVEDKVKEKPPMEYRKVTNWMGWTEDGRKKKAKQ